MITRRTTLILLLALIATGSWWMQHAIDQRPELVKTLVEIPGIDGREAPVPLTLMDESPEARAARLLSAGYSEVITPVIHMHEPLLPPLRLESETGWIARNGDEVRLLGEVTVNRPEAHPDGPLHLVTRDLTIFPQRQHAETEAHAVATAPGYRIEGTGMRMDLDEQTVLLLSEVKGRHESRQQP
jgi:lipopolysaccharide export system protein LptC